MAVLAKPVTFQDVAILVHPADNVAVVREPLSAGTSIKLAE